MSSGKTVNAPRSTTVGAQAKKQFAKRLHLNVGSAKAVNNAIPPGINQKKAAAEADKPNAKG